MLSDIEKAKVLYKQTKHNILENMFKEEENNIFISVPILETKFSRTFEHINSGAPIMFISACHSLGDDRKYTDEEIEAQNKQNIEDSKKLNMKLDLSLLFYIKTNGHWIAYNSSQNKFVDNPEFTFMVVGYDILGNIIDFEEFKQIGIKLCKEYNQYAVMIGRKTEDGYDFKYYTSTGDIDMEFTKGYKIDSGNKINELLNEYNSGIQAYTDKINKGEKLTEEEKKLFEEEISKHYGSTEIHNKNNKNRRLNLVFENNVTIKGPSYPHNRGIRLFTEVK